jgi:DNA-3-methyladenine glycosylase
MRKTLGKDFFERPTLTVARELLGKWLVRRTADGETARLITEVEAYDGPKDRASHASRGLTPRNAPMFGAAGIWYVYLCYGVHWMVNVVTGPKGFPAAVLIRGVDGLSGPGRVTKGLLISDGQNGLRAGRPSGLWFEDRGTVVRPGWIRRTPRIGVGYAGEWAVRPYRFVLEAPESIIEKRSDNEYNAH